MPLLWINKNQAINPERIVMITVRLTPLPGHVNNTENQQLLMRIDTDQQSDREAFMVDVVNDFAITCYSQLRELGILMPNKEIDDFVAGELNCQKNNPLLNTPIEDFTTSVRVYNCLKRGQIKNLGMLLNSRWSELVKIHNFGRRSWHELVLFITEINNQHGTNFKLLDQ